MSDPLGEFIKQNQSAWEERQANYDQIVKAFGSVRQSDESSDVLLAQALRLSDTRSDAGGGAPIFGTLQQRNDRVHANGIALDALAAEVNALAATTTPATGMSGLTDAQRAALAAGYGPLNAEAAAAKQNAVTAIGMSNDQAYALYMASGGRSASYVTPAVGWSYGEVSYDLMGDIAGGTGAVASSLDNISTAVGKGAALSVLGSRAYPLHAARMADIARSAELSGAMTFVGPTSNSGQAMARVAGATRVLGPIGVAASVTEILADVAGAPHNQQWETAASTATSVAVGGVTVYGGAKIGAVLGFTFTGGQPIGGIVGGAIGGIGAAFGYEYGVPKLLGSGSDAVKESVLDGLLRFNGKK